MTLPLASLRPRLGVRRYIGPKRLFLVAIVATFIFYLWHCHYMGMFNPSFIVHYHVNHPFLSIFLFILIYALLVMASVPSLPLNLAAGFFWGGLVGGVYTTLGVTLGSWLSFTLARWLVGQPLSKQLDQKLLRKVQQEFDRNRWKFVAFVRLNPIIPTGPFNYMLGLTAISNFTFLWTTFVFLMLPSVVVAYIGDILQTFAIHKSDVSEIIKTILIISAIVTFLMTLKFFFRVMRAPKEL